MRARGYLGVALTAGAAKDVAGAVGGVETVAVAPNVIPPI